VAAALPAPAADGQPLRVTHLAAGEAAPFDGVLLSDATYAAVEDALRRCGEAPR